MFRNASILTSRHAFLAQLYVDYRYLSSRRTITKGKTRRKIGEMEERRMWSHESLTLDLKSILWKNTKDGRESIHYSIHLHFTRVAWFTGYSRTTASQHRRHSFHFTALVANHPENKPLSDDVHPRLSLEPDTCSSFPACTRLASSMG